jgi:hypothetical protein
VRWAVSLTAVDLGHCVRVVNAAHALVQVIDGAIYDSVANATHAERGDAENDSYRASTEVRFAEEAPVARDECRMPRSTSSLLSPNARPRAPKWARLKLGSWGT